MPRETAAMPTALWRDPNFTDMPWQAQLLYFQLSTQPDLNQAGYLPLLPRRWASMSKGGDADNILRDLDVLIEREWAWADHDLQEVLVRRHTPPAGHKQLQGALQATFAMTSVRLRQIAAALLLAPSESNGLSRGSSPIAKMRLAVYERDSYACQACGWMPDIPPQYDGRFALGAVSLDESAGMYRVRLLELDHVYPNFLGGEFKFENLQALCNSCNASKGARV